MDQGTFQAAARFLLRRPGLLDEGASLVWHCGEPLSIPISFYRAAFEFLDSQNPGPSPIAVSFSTNATLIDQEWCDLIRSRGNIRMRVSIDGPQWLHDSTRVDRAGKGTFERVMRGINLLRVNGIPFDVLCVISKRSLDAPEELWRFFRGIDAKGVGFCVEEVLGENHISTLQIAESAERVRRFFDVWFQLREAEAPEYYVRELDQIIEMLERRDDEFVRSDNLPLNIITIAWDGSVCLFSPELLELKHIHYGDFILGNVATDCMESILESEKFHSVYSAILDGVGQCRRECKAYYRVCGGGFPVSKLIENGKFQSSETLTCRLRVKAITDAVVRRMRVRRETLNGRFGARFRPILPPGAALPLVQISPQSE
jgi:uncharacterized protein